MRRALRFSLATLLAAGLVAACSSSNDTFPQGTPEPTSASAAGSTTTLSVAPGTTDDTTNDTTNDTTGDTTGATDTTDPNTTTDGSTEDTAAGDPIDERPFDVFAPSSYRPDTAMPLVVVLHGFGASGDIQEAYFQMQPLAEERGFLYAHPDGTVNVIGRQFWNATDACCGFGSVVDDSAYLSSLIEEVRTEFNVDPKRIYLVGHSNGGFMSYRMACDHADTIAAIASLAGATFADPTDCDPSEPVSVLQVHGTDDDTIAFDGGALLGNPHPSAPATVATWAEYDGCANSTTDEANVLDLDSGLAGAETSTSAKQGCPEGVAVELWTIEGGAHIPARTPALSSGIIDFLFAHPKP